MAHATLARRIAVLESRVCVQSPQVPHLSPCEEIELIINRIFSIFAKAGPLAVHEYLLTISGCSCDYWIKRAKERGQLRPGGIDERSEEFKGKELPAGW